MIVITKTVADNLVCIIGLHTIQSSNHKVNVFQKKNLPSQKMVKTIYIPSDLSLPSISFLII